MTSPAKARQILKDGKVRGKKLTKKQRGLFGVQTKPHKHVKGRIVPTKRKR